MIDRRAEDHMLLTQLDPEHHCGHTIRIPVVRRDTIHELLLKAVLWAIVILILGIVAYEAMRVVQ